MARGPHSSAPIKENVHLLPTVTKEPSPTLTRLARSSILKGTPATTERLASATLAPFGTREETRLARPLLPFRVLQRALVNGGGSETQEILQNTNGGPGTPGMTWPQGTSGQGSGTPSYGPFSPQNIEPYEGPTSEYTPETGSDFLPTEYDEPWNSESLEEDPDPDPDQDPPDLDLDPDPDPDLSQDPNPEEEDSDNGDGSSEELGSLAPSVSQLTRPVIARRLDASGGGAIQGVWDELPHATPAIAIGVGTAALAWLVWHGWAKHQKGLRRL